MNFSAYGFLFPKLNTWTNQIEYFPFGSALTNDQGIASMSSFIAPAITNFTGSHSIYAQGPGNTRDQGAEFSVTVLNANDYAIEFNKRRQAAIQATPAYGVLRGDELPIHGSFFNNLPYGAYQQRYEKSIDPDSLTISYPSRPYSTILFSPDQMYHSLANMNKPNHRWERLYFPQYSADFMVELSDHGLPTASSNMAYMVSYLSQNQDYFPNANWQRYWVCSSRPSTEDVTMSFFVQQHTTYYNGSVNAPTEELGLAIVKLTVPGTLNPPKPNPLAEPTKKNRLSTTGSCNVISGIFDIAQAKVMNGILYLQPIAAAVSYKRFTILPVGVLVPESVQVLDYGPGPNATKPDVAYKTAIEISVASWENSFSTTSYEQMAQWWVINDPDHVRVRIPRPDMAGKGPIKVSIETKNVSSLSQYNDPANEVELTELSTEPGIFECVFILVSDDVDDTWDGLDESFKDYTHKIAVGGELIIRHEGTEISRLKVAEKGRIKLRPLVFWYGGLGGGAALSDAEVTDDITDIRERLAQAGVAVEWNGNEQPWGIAAPNVPGVSDHFKQSGMETSEGGLLATSDETAFSSYINSTYPSLNGTKTIVLVYERKVWHDAGGYYSDDDERSYTLTPTIASQLGVHPMIVTTAKRNSHTMAHEMMHMLLDDTHPPSLTGRHNE